jgi:hypothetical protein
MKAPGGKEVYSSYSFSTSSLDGVSGQHHAPATLLPPGKESPVPIVLEAGWALEPVWAQGLEEKSSAPVGDRTPVVQSVVRQCTDWATLAPTIPRNTVETNFWKSFLTVNELL